MRRRTFTAGALALGAAPGAAWAQAPGRTYRIAVWHTARLLAELAADGAPAFRTLYQELKRLGFIEGSNLVVDRYSGEGRTERYEAIAHDIVNSKPDAIAINGAVPAVILGRLTSTIPIVLLAVTDPLASGLVQSLARPGGNVTGFTQDGGLELAGLRLQLLKEAVPGSARLGYLTTQRALIDGTVGILQQAAAALGVELVVFPMGGIFDSDNYRTAFEEFARQRVDGISVSQHAEHTATANRKVIIALAAAAKLPAIYAFREHIDDGGLMAYGADLVDNYRKAAGYVARILNGEKPGDLPIQQPTVFDMIVNLRTARALGITIPESIMIRATEVIE